MAEKIIHQRDLCDRRNWFDRRRKSNPCKNERRLNMERRYILDEKRSAWARETKWRSVYVDLLR
jgi:hypothetical protein